MTINPNYIALWGAVLSTILGLIKIYELWSSRRKVEITCYFDSRPEVGNDVIVRNISDKQIILTYWQLLFYKKEKFRWKEFNSEEPCEDAHDILIPPHSSKKFNFSEQYYFSWGVKAMENKRIYFKIFIAGKKRPIKSLMHK
jgi:hypothetical protein